MKSCINTFLIILAIILITGCNKDDNPNGPNIFEEFSYPLKTGNRWEYLSVSSQTCYRQDSTYHETADSSSITIEITKREVLYENANTFVLEETERRYNITSVDYSYYDNREDGLYLFAYKGSGDIIPKSSITKKIVFNGKTFTSTREIMNYLTKNVPSGYVNGDSLIHENPPLQSIKYPVESGSQWIYRPAGNPWRIDKKIVDFEKIEVPAGKFNCFKIQWIYNWSMDEEIVFYDYVCDKGLIKRSILITGSDLYDVEGNIIGTSDSKDEYILVNFTLN